MKFARPGREGRTDVPWLNSAIVREQRRARALLCALSSPSVAGHSLSTRWAARGCGDFWSAEERRMRSRATFNPYRRSCLSEASSADPRRNRAPQVARSAAKGRRQ